jgi:hypothetical protein
MNPSMRKQTHHRIGKSQRVVANWRRRPRKSLAAEVHFCAGRPRTIRWPRGFGRINWPKRPSGWME